MENVLLTIALVAAGLPLLGAMLWLFIRLALVLTYRAAFLEQTIKDAIADGITYVRSSNAFTRNFVRIEAARRRRIQHILNSTHPGQLQNNSQQIVQQSHAELQMRDLLFAYKRAVGTCNDLHNYRAEVQSQINAQAHMMEVLHEPLLLSHRQNVSDITDASIEHLQQSGLSDPSHSKNLIGLQILSQRCGPNHCHLFNYEAAKLPRRCAAATFAGIK